MVVEVDGATHSTGEELAHDNRRTGFLKSEGYTVIRFQNDEILNGIDEVLNLSCKHCAIVLSHEMGEEGTRREATGR